MFSPHLYGLEEQQPDSLFQEEISFQLASCCFLHPQAEVKEKASIEDAKKEEAVSAEDPRGIPEFWLTIFKSVDMLSDMLQVRLHAPACSPHTARGVSRSEAASFSHMSLLAASPGAR